MKNFPLFPKSFSFYWGHHVPSVLVYYVFIFTYSLIKVKFYWIMTNIYWTWLLRWLLCKSSNMSAHFSRKSVFYIIYLTKDTIIMFQGWIWSSSMYSWRHVPHFIVAFLTYCVVSFWENIKECVTNSAHFWRLLYQMPGNGTFVTHKR